MPDFLEAETEELALEKLHEMGCTDGLPVVIPSQERVERLILATGLDGDMVLGEMGPGMGMATIEKVCVAAVMAGCLPDYMPIVIKLVFVFSCIVDRPPHNFFLLLVHVYHQKLSIF